MAVSLRKRASGLLLHISSLPSRSGIGDFGSQAFRFIDMLEKSCQSYWQVLPLNPTIPSKARSPYAPASAFAGNILFISPELLYEDNLAGKEILDTRTGSVNNTGSGKVEFRTVEKNRKKILDIAYEKFKSGFSASLKDDFDSFCLLNKKWLNDYAAFKAFHDFFLKNCKKKGWAYWPPPIRDRETEEIKILAERLSDEISKEKFCQFIFLRQWINLKKYAAEKNI